MKHELRSRKSGRYTDGPRCEVCHRPAGWKYLSHPDGGVGLVICRRRSCEWLADVNVTKAVLVAEIERRWAE